MAESEYTPTLDELREAWIEANVITPSDIEAEQRVVVDAEFDRAIERVRAEARAEQREKDAQIAESRTRLPVGAGTDGSVTYQETSRFPDDGRAIAAAIRAGGSR